MRKRTTISLFLLGVMLSGCKAATKTDGNEQALDFNKEFPVTEKLEFNSFNTYDVWGRRGTCMIDGAVLWYFAYDDETVGSCYDLNTGKELATIALKGEEPNELVELDGFKLVGDSVLLYPNRNTIKAFAKKDIINNVPLEDRTCSVVTLPQDVLAAQITKTPNGSLLATIHPAVFEFEKSLQNKLNEKSVALFSSQGIKSFETIPYESFRIEEAKENELSSSDLLKWAYAQGRIGIRDDSLVVFSVNDQFILYTLNLNAGKVGSEKRYSIIQRNGTEMSFATTNEKEVCVRDMKVNDKYIVCEVDGILSETDENIGKREKALFVFDWNLKPIKRFELPVREEGFYRVANDCSAVYFCKPNGGGLVLYKADLNI